RRRIIGFYSFFYQSFYNLLVFCPTLYLFFEISVDNCLAKNDFFKQVIGKTLLVIECGIALVQIMQVFRVLTNDVTKPNPDTINFIRPMIVSFGNNIFEFAAVTKTFYPGVFNKVFVAYFFV